MVERAASHGHSAKVLDIALKVYVYYCGQPAENTGLLLPLLHSALDTPMIEHLHRRFPKAGLSAWTILQVDEDEYRRMQSLVATEIATDFRSEIFPVQYDDIMWRRLNRTGSRQGRLLCLNLT